MVLASGARKEGSDFPKQRDIQNLALCCCYWTMLLTTSLPRQKIDFQKYFFTLQACFNGFLTNFLLVFAHAVLGQPKLNLTVNNLNNIFNFARVYLLGICYVGFFKGHFLHASPLQQQAKYVVKMMFCQILHFASVLKTHLIKMVLIVQELFTFRIATVTGIGECALCGIIRSLIC